MAPLDYAWTGSFGIAAGATPLVALPLGETTATLDLVDAEEQTGTDQTIIDVRDTTPPSFAAATATPACLWPPNHKLVAFELGNNVAVDVTDSCDTAPTVRIVGIESSEPDDGQGDGTTLPDFA